MRFKYGTPRTEIAYGTATDGFVINVDTQLMAATVDGIIAPVSAWGDVWNSIPAPISDAIIAAGGSADIPWNTSSSGSVALAETISYKHVLDTSSTSTFYRNANVSKGYLVNDLLATTEATENLESIVVHTDTDILPIPTINTPGVIWIGGERIEYSEKQPGTAPNTWLLSFISRGTRGTSCTLHLALSYVWIEINNEIPDSPDTFVWSAINPMPDTTSEILDPVSGLPYDPPRYSKIMNVADGGLWYANTSQAVFLKEAPGAANS